MGEKRRKDPMKGVVYSSHYEQDREKVSEACRELREWYARRRAERGREEGER